jgi:Fur family ferric uptake transcriptional regulator
MEEIIKKIKDKGGRLTKTRLNIVSILSEGHVLFSSKEILEKLRKSGQKVDRTTVYRELQFLLEKEIVKQILLSDTKTRYEIAQKHHHHLICTRCKNIKEVNLKKDLKKEEKEINNKSGFKVTNHTLEFYGLCAKCYK